MKIGRTGRTRWIWSLGAAALLGSLAASLSCHGRGDAGPFPGAPIIVISIDTLRSDHLPAYGYKGVETPALDALRKDAILFERVYSHTPLTLPSHVSLLTGELPGRHGVRDNIGYPFDSAKHPFLPRLLGGAGYATGAAVSAYVLRGETGIAKGFDFFDDGITLRPTEALGNSQRSGRESSHAALGWLQKVEAKPFFLLLHLYEPHTPYEPPEPFASRYRSAPYDGEIATADSIVGDFLAELKKRGLYDKAVILLLSDHGEGLGDHGEQEHGILLYREALQVPLFLKLPGSRLAGTSVAAPAQLTDVAPTLLALAGQPVPQGLDGGSLLDLRNGGKPARPIYSETWYPRLHFGWSELASLIQDHSHYIDGPQPELFDLAADPGEKQSILTQERRTYAALRDEVVKRKTPLAAPAQADAESAAKLASLGYLAAGVKTGSGPLPDPRSKIATLDLLSKALAAYSAQQYSAAVPLFQQLLADNPHMADAWEHLGRALTALGRRDEALTAYKEAMEETSGVGHVAIATGWLLLEMGRLDEARDHAALALGTDASPAHNLLGQIALARKDYPTAEKEARSAIAAGGSRIGPFLTLAQTLKAEGQLDKALEITQQAVTEVGSMEGAPKYSGLWFLHGDLLARAGRDAEAEQAFRKEIEDFPANTDAYTRLAVLYTSQNRSQEAVAALRAMVERNDSPLAYIEAVRTLRTLGDPQSAAALLQYARARHPESKELRGPV
ncbi:MAG TPA: sulfatase-like hydrolase/transferase [Thermoanaerobaculia bacterium]|nr:sulfatase-like hydrolase/transferase [Thermoanaerobaculia bacterium]